MTGIKDAIGRSVSRRSFLGTTALAGVGVVGASTLLSACGGSSSGGTGGGTGGGGGGGSLTWSNWANPGEQTRFKEFSTDYQTKTGVKVTYQTVTGDYNAKILTQLAGGSAPDVFYIGDTQISKLISSKNIQPLDDLANAADSPVKIDSTFAGLREWTKGSDGKTYGIVVDCNPSVFWFNKKILSDAGVATDPAAAFEAGTWTLDTFTDLLTKVTASGKKAMIIEAAWFNWWGLITSQGGKMLDDDGKAIFDQDAKAKEVITWMIEQFKAGTLIYAGSLPKGQGVDALFYAGQLALINYGRWVLPNLKKLNGSVSYDIAPYPTPEPNKVQSVPVYTAAMGINAKAKDTATDFKFLGAFCNADGQKFRLSGGGNAVPSQEGLDDLVTEGNDPAHAKYLLETAKVGFAVPKPLTQNPEKAANFGAQIDALLNPEPLKSMTADKFISTVVAYLNK